MLSRGMKDLSACFFVSVPSIRCYSSCITLRKCHAFSSLLLPLVLFTSQPFHSLCSKSVLSLPSLVLSPAIFFLLPLFQGQQQGLGLSFSSTREQDDTVIYGSTGHPSCPGSSHGPSHQTLSTSIPGLFCVSGATCFPFHNVHEFPVL